MNLQELERLSASLEIIINSLKEQKSKVDKKITLKKLLGKMQK